MKRQLAIIVSSVAVIVGFYVAVNSELPLDNGQNEENSSPAASYAINYDNPRVLVGYAQEVFAAKVLAERGNNPQTLPGGSQLAHYQYEVEVLYNIKGTASGRIQVDIEAFEGARLVPGNTYILAARHWAETEPWYYVGSPNAFHVSISQSSRLTNEELTDIVKKHSRTYELLNAYPNEILRDIDIQKGRTINSFQSLFEANKRAVYDKFQELIPPRPVPEILPPISTSRDSIPENSWSRCGDKEDNDKDGLIDKADPDCGGALREDLPALCGDNIDNDRDGFTDSADPDCAQFYPPQPPPPPPSAPLPPENFAPSPTAPTSTPPAPAPTSTGQ